MGNTNLHNSKENGTVRFISDFRYLNKCLVRRPYLIPKIADVLQKFEGIRYATSLDLNMGYYRSVDIHLRKKFIVCNRRKIFYAGANTHKASNAIARNGVTSFVVYRYYYYFNRNLRIIFTYANIEN